MLKDFLTRVGITKLLGSVRIGGLTVKEHLDRNTENTVTGFKNLFRRVVFGGVPLDQAIEQAGKLSKRRKRQTLTTIKNIMGAVRGQVRAIQVGRKSGAWHNNGILDGKTTSVCTGYMYSSWELPYAQIPDKPPRVAVTPHPCRSFLTFVKDGDTAPAKTSFMEQFNGDEALQAELLGPTRFDAFKRGELQIRSFPEYEKSVLNTLDDLGL